MFEILPESKGDIIAIKAVGKLVDADYKETVPKLEAMIEEAGGQAKFLFDMTELKGWSLKAALDDAAFGIKDRKKMVKLAAIGNKRWEKDAFKLCAPICQGEIKYFDESEREQAWKWIKE